MKREKGEFAWLLVTGLLLLWGGSTETMAQGPEASAAESLPEVPAFLEQFEWVEYVVPVEGMSCYLTLHRTGATDGEGSELLAIYAGILKRYEPETDRWVDAITEQKKEYGLVALTTGFFEAADGTVWLETGKGLLAYRPRTTSKFKEEDIQEKEPGSVFSIIFLPFDIIGGLIGGLVELVVGPEGLEVKSFCEAGERELWFGTAKKGLLHYLPPGPDAEGAAQPGRWEVFRTDSESKLPSNRVTALAARAPNTVWVGTGDGLVVWRKGKRVDMPAIDRELGGRTISLLHVTKDGQLWVGTNNPTEALFVVSREERLTEVTRQARRPNWGMPYFYDMPLETRSGQLWLRRWTEKEEYLEQVGGLEISIRSPVGAGLLRVLELDGSLQCQSHTVKGAAGDSADGIVGGLVDDWVKAVAEDADGRLWVLTNPESSGKDRSGVSVFDPKANRWYTVLSLDGRSPVGGAVPDRAKLCSVVVAADGSVWFGGRDRLYRLRSRVVGPRRR